MNATDLTPEARFIASLQGFQHIDESMQRECQRLHDALALLTRRLQAQRHDRDLTGGALYDHAQTLRTQIARSIEHWSQEWDEAQVMRDFSDSLSNKMVILVFGKVNAGKSTLCNFIAGRFAAHGFGVRHFYLEDGECHASHEGFVEGATETTQRIQGVELGDHLVLLDTPGLHSVTEANAALTRRFTDAADAVLWTTPSTAPGQVQELEELRMELCSGKPLLPVITRSDRREQDEIDGKLVDVLHNKSAANRQLQESDVFNRAQEKLLAGGSASGRALTEALRNPVSVSVAYARQHAEEDDALSASGIARLFGALIELGEEAQTKKHTKPVQLIRAHWEKVVKQDLRTALLPQMEAFEALSRRAIDDLRAGGERISAKVVCQALLALPELLDRFRNRRDRTGLLTAIGERVSQDLQEALSEVLSDYRAGTQDMVFALNPDDAGDFEDIYIEVEQRAGALASALTSGGSAASAALATAYWGGALLGGVLGVLAASALAGWLGKAAGDALFVETERVKIPVGVSQAKLSEHLTEQLRVKVPALVTAQIEQCSGYIVQAAAEVRAMQAQINAFLDQDCHALLAE